MFNNSRLQRSLVRSVERISGGVYNRISIDELSADLQDTKMYLKVILLRERGT